MRLLVTLLSVFIFVANPVGAQVLRIDLRGEIPDGEGLVVFDGQLLTPAGESRDVFTGPYTLRLLPEVREPGQYVLGVDFLGLGPEYRNYSYSFEQAATEEMLIPSLPLKNEAVINYFITIADDTSSLSPAADSADVDSVADQGKWGVSASIHFRTHWQQGSLADFMWNVKMSWLENVYDQYRHSFRLSTFEKIDLYFHPEWTDEVYLRPRAGYGILPLSRRIDVVFGHDYNAVTPSLAAELLIYRLWGYGPRWMVVGFSHYYDDGQLVLRNFADKLDAGKITAEFSRYEWLNSDTASIFLGGFVNWLVDIYSQSKFKRLYRLSSPLDYAEKFRQIYDTELRGAVDRYLEYIRSYVPEKGELGYYASINMEQYNLEKARDYYAELASNDDDDKKENLSSLAACQFWLGEYSAAEKTYDELIEISDPDDRPRLLKLKGDMNMALGDFSDGIGLYKEAFNEGNYGNAGLALVTILIDSEDFQSARELHSRLGDDVLSISEYYIESARLRIFYGEPGVDSLLAPVVARAMNGALQTPHYSRYYLIAGMALGMQGQFDKAGENLEIAHFLERRPYYQALALLELGRLFDLKGDHRKAVEYYRRVVGIGGGEYLSSLARKYIEKPYELKHEE
jgi:tetratricopeptide (TPR) repeat protein